jgi:GTP:adenosylcobinamide-phosphate guanylyltransferase
MDAIVTAGGIPQPGEPLYAYTRGASKALLDVAGKPMIQWVLDALDEATSVDRVVIIGLPPQAPLTCRKLAGLIPNQGGMLDNVRAGVARVLELNPQAHHVLTVSSDIPTITPEMVDWTVNTAMETQDELYYTVITRQVMESRFPNSKRSYINFKDMSICGGDMNIIAARTGTNNDALWERIIAARKNVFKQAALVGYDTLFLLLFRLVTLDQAVRMVTSRLKIKGRVLRCPYAEIGMDIDKPFQLEIVKDDFLRRVSV